MAKKVTTKTFPIANLRCQTPSLFLAYENNFSSGAGFQTGTGVTLRDLRRPPTMNAQALLRPMSNILVRIAREDALTAYSHGAARHGTTRCVSTMRGSTVFARCQPVTSVRLSVVNIQWRAEQPGRCRLVPGRYCAFIDSSSLRLSPRSRDNGEG